MKVKKDDYVRVENIEGFFKIIELDRAAEKMWVAEHEGKLYAIHEDIIISKLRVLDTHQ